MVETENVLMAAVEFAISELHRAVESIDIAADKVERLRVVAACANDLLDEAWPTTSRTYTVPEQQIVDLAEALRWLRKEIPEPPRRPQLTEQERQERLAREPF